MRNLELLRERDLRTPSSRSILLLAAFFTMAGCAPSMYGRSVYGTEGGFSLENAKPKLVSPMVAQKIERPLFIVLDSERLGDTWALETPPCSTNSSGCERFNLLDVHTFVHRDLKTAMENYFSEVRVVGSYQELPAVPHVVADVKVDEIRLNHIVRGQFIYALIEMTWGFAMRLGEHDDYAYSFAGKAISNDTYPNFEAGCATMIERAIPAMLKAWVEDGGMTALRDAARSNVAPATRPTGGSAATGALLGPTG